MFNNFSNPSVCIAFSNIFWLCRNRFSGLKCSGFMISKYNKNTVRVIFYLAAVVETLAGLWWHLWIQVLSCKVSSFLQATQSCYVKTRWNKTVQSRKSAKKHLKFYLSQTQSYMVQHKEKCLLQHIVLYNIILTISQNSTLG